VNPVSALVLFGLPLGIFSFADRLGNKASVNVSSSGDSDKSSVAFSASQRRNQAAQLCAA